MSPEVTEAPHIRGIKVRKETGEKQAGLGANKKAVEEPNLHKLPVWQEVGVDSSQEFAERGRNVKWGRTGVWRVT